MVDKIKQIMVEAIEELNEQLDLEDKIQYDENLVLIGSKAALDSISFVTLIVIIEDMVAEQLGKNIIIVSDKAFSQQRSPFHTVATLTNYIIELAAEES
jgi:acyl carrier protein